MPNTITFPMDPTKFATKKASLISQAESQNFTISFDNDSGNISGDGVKAEISYNGVDTLSVTITHKPFFVTEGFVESKIKTWINS